jgi:translocation and assembly module TamB
VPSLAPIHYIGTPPPGVQLQAPSLPAATGLPPLGLALRILAPDEIFIRGRGIDVELGGEITLGGTLAAPRPSGAFRLRRGQLDILARRLEFKRGTIAFRAGSFEPELDLLAQAVTRGYTISVAVEGSPSAPNITLTSSPELPQDEVMAQLLFNRTTSNLSPFEIAQIAQAIAQLTGIGGGFDPLGKARALLGLDRLGVGSAVEGQTGAALEAGKYLMPGVYVGVRQGMQGGQTGVSVQLEVTPTLKLEGQTATGPAGDRLGVTWEYEY